MRPLRPGCLPEATVWPAMAFLAILTLLKFAAALWSGSILLLAQAGYTSGELLLLLAVLPAVRRAGCSSPVRGVVCFICSAILVFPAAFLLWKGMLLLGGRNTAEPAPALLSIMLVFVLAELFLWYRLSSMSRRLRSLDAAVAAGSIRVDLWLMGGLIPLHAAATYNWLIPEALAVTGFGVLILMQAMGLARFALSGLPDSYVMEKVLRPVRERAASLNGVAAVSKVKGFRSAAGGGLHLQLRIVVGCGRDRRDIEQVKAAVRSLLEESFRDVALVSVQAVSLRSLRECSFPF